MDKTIFLCVLTLISIGCQSKDHSGSKEDKMEKDLTISQTICKQLSISDDMILPTDSLGMDSLMHKYQSFCNGSLSDEGEDDEPHIDERYINILIPYAFNDLLKKGFVPISANQYTDKLRALGLDSLQRQSLPYIYEYKHYFTSPTNMQGWQDDIAEDGIDHEEEEYIRFAAINDIFVKGYNFLLPRPTLETFVDDKKAAFRLKDEIIHLNKFLFNNSKSSLIWLLHNSPITLKDLLVSYGYDTNEAINKLVLNEVLESFSNVEDVSGLINIFIRKIYANRPYVDIREGLLKMILQMPANERNLQWLTILDAYIYCLMSEKTKERPYWISNFTKTERFKIAAYLGYYLHKDYLRYNRTEPTFYAHEIYYNDDFRKYLEEHHYFNLTGFKEMSDSIYDEYDLDVKAHQTME